MFEYRISSKLNQWPKVAVESWLKQFLKLLTVEEGFGVDFFDAVKFIEGLIFGFQFQRKYPAGDVRSVVLQHDFMLMSGIFTPIASLGGNPHLRQSAPVFCRCDALNLPQRCRPTWQLTESLLPPRSGPPLYLLRSKKLQENQMTSFFRLEPEIFLSQQQTKFLHSTRGYPARYSLGVIPVWVLKNLWNDGIDWKLRR